MINNVGIIGVHDERSQLTTILITSLYHQFEQRGVRKKGEREEKKRKCFPNNGVGRKERGGGRVR